MKKKNLLILALLAGASPFLASCSNDELVAENYNDPDAISFTPLLTGVTRALSINSTSELQSQGFNVTAIVNGTSTAYFTGEDYTWNSTANAYTSTTKHYWPWEGSLDFYAYSPISDTYVGTGKQIVRTDYKTFDVTPSATPSEQVDFVYANTNAKTKGSDGKVTTLNFRHAESNIVIQLKNTSTDLKFTVKDVAIGYILPTAKFAYTGSTNGTTPVTNTDAASGYYLTGWGAPTGTRTSYSQTASTTSYAAGAAASALTNNMILIPHTIVAATEYSAASSGSAFNGAYISIELKVQDSSDHYIVGKASGDGEWVTAMWPLTAITWLPGHKYTYTVDLKGGGYYPTNHDEIIDLDPILEGSEIMFASVTVDDWSDGGTEFVDAPSYVAGNNRTLDVRTEASTYTFYVTGFAANEAVTIGTGGTTSIFNTVTPTGSTTADASGVLKITFTVNETTGANNGTITIDSATDSHDTTITISQPAAS